MLKCRICIERKGESKDFKLINLHLLKKHGMLPKEYLQRYPNAKLSSSKFRAKQRQLMFERRKNDPNYQEKLHAWLHEISKSHYPDVFENPSIDDFEALKQREKWCRLMLGSGIKGGRYRRIYRDLMEVRQALEILFEQLMKMEE